MKKKALITASALSCIFAAAAYSEWTGYEYFDRKDGGSNIQCTLDPGCRHLTPGEITLAKKYFGDDLDYNSVKIYNRAFMFIFGHTRNGIAPNGNIYFGKSERRSPNFAHENYYEQSYFIHEMMHVAQKQRGLDIPKQAFIELVKHAFDYDEAYYYDINSPEPFNQMNLEQQAKMMEDYFVMRHEFNDATTFIGMDGNLRRFHDQTDSFVVKQCAEMAKYETKFRGYYSVGRDEMCQGPKMPSLGIKLKLVNN